MNITPNLIGTQAHDLPIGHLGTTEFGSEGRCLLIRLNGGHVGRQPLLVIPITAAGRANGIAFYETSLGDRISCLSFGADCLLDFSFDDDGEATHPASRSQLGVLTLTEEGPVVKARVIQRSPYDDTTFVNLKTLQVVSRPHTRLYTERWSVWGSAADRLSPHGQPAYVHQPFTGLTGV